MIDELRLHVAPVVIDAGYVRLFDGVGPITWSSVSGAVDARGHPPRLPPLNTIGC